jgi:hypothetical protein
MCSRRFVQGGLELRAKTLSAGRHQSPGPLVLKTETQANVSFYRRHALVLRDTQTVRSIRLKTWWFEQCFAASLFV